MGSTVLLFGMPRSGTTWAAKILDSHPGTLYRHEPDSFGALNHVPYAPELADADRYRESLVAFVRRLPEINATKVAGSLPQFPKRYYSALAYRLHLAAVSAAKLAALVFGECPVPHIGRGGRRDDVTVVWKSIESLTRLPVLARVLDRRRAIVLLRHPCGYAASTLRGEATGQFTGSETAAEDWGTFELLLATGPARRRGLTLAHLRGLSAAERLTWLWILSNEMALEGIRGVDGCAWVRYEDLCDEPEPGARRLLEMSGLDWNPQTAEFVRRSTAAHDDAYFSIFKDPRRAANRWRKELPERDIERVRRVLGESDLASLYPDLAGAADHGAVASRSPDGGHEHRPATAPDRPDASG